jgi:hypothetical protein
MVLPSLGVSGEKTRSGCGARSWDWSLVVSQTWTGMGGGVVGVGGGPAVEVGDPAELGEQAVRRRIRRRVWIKVRRRR